MPEDVFNHDDGVVDQQAERQNQRKQGDAVDALPRDQTDRERDEQNQRNGDGDDRSGAPAEEKHQQQHHGADGDGEMLHERVDRVVGLGAVVARDVHPHVRGDHRGADARQFAQRFVGDRHRVGPGALGDGDDHGRNFIVRRSCARECRAVTDAVRALDLLGAVADRGHLLQVHRPVRRQSDHQVADVVRVLQHAAGLHRGHAIAAHERARGDVHVGGVDHLADVGKRDVVGVHPVEIEADVDRAPASAVHVGERRAFDAAQVFEYVVGRASKLTVFRAGAREGDGQDRHVVHVRGLDQRLQRSRRHVVHVAHDAVVELDQRFFLVLSDLELHAHHAGGAHRRSIGVIDAGQSLEDRLERLDDELFDFVGRGPGFLHDDIRRRYHDARILLARGNEEREHPREEREQHDQQRELAVDEIAGDPAGEVEAVFGTGWPSVFFSCHGGGTSGSRG